MDRTIIDPLEQMRDFDFVSFEHDALLGLGALAKDVLSQLPTTVVAGFVATQTGSPSLSITIGSGRIYQFAAADSTSSGSIAQDSTIIVQQGQNAGQTITLTPPSSGQSQWNLIQAQFSQVDAVRANDPNGGIVPFYNAANPTQPTTQSINTVRQGLCVLQVITGAPATTGSQVPPTPSVGWVPLYLISLAGGQTQITTSQILAAGPSVGTGVPNNYQVAPFLAGFLASHHNGNPGQAPKINLVTEVQGVLPYVNMSPVRTLLNANLNLFVSATAGSDTNNGLSPTSAFKTIQAAINAIFQNYDFNGFQPVINLAAGTYTTAASIRGAPVGMSPSGSVSIIGNTTNPATVTISTSAPCVSAFLGASVTVSGVTMTSTGAPTTTAINGAALYSWGGASLNFSRCVFGACNFAHMVAQQSGQVALNFGVSGAYTITGGSGAHLYADVFGLVNCELATVTITGSPAFSTAFAFSSRSSLVQATSSTYTGAVTGPRFIANLNAVITTSSGNVNFFPGSTAGATATGGQYT